MPFIAHWELALVGALPALVAMAYFDRLDARRPEPRGTLRRVAAASGICAAAVIGLGQAMASAPPLPTEASYSAVWFSAVVLSAIPEEGLKALAVVLFAWRRPEFDERMDGIVYGARAGLGFALVENVAYLFLLPGSLDEYLAMLLGRAVLVVPGHATWGALMGYFAARHRFDGRGPGLLGGYAIAVLLHGLYDGVLFSAPVGIAHGHEWLRYGLFGVPLLAYAVPALIVLLGALWLRKAAGVAIAADDRDERFGIAPHRPGSRSSKGAP